MSSDMTIAALRPRFLVGRDDLDHWVVMAADGRSGGIFCNEAAALRFAREECGGMAGAVREIGHIDGDFLNPRPRVGRAAA